MKRLTLFAAALMVAVSSFAAVSYELNGGVTNPDGWTTPSDMFAAFMTDAGASGFEPLDYYKAQGDPLSDPNICAKLTSAAPAFALEEWAWLKAYIEAVHAAQAADGASALSGDGSSPAWRYAVGAFFIDGQRASWPISADFTHIGAGTPAAFMPTWKAAYDNPTEPTGTFTLNTPYKEGATFDGWYAAADFSGEKVTTIDATTTGTLYAKWVEYIPTIAEVLALADNTQTKVAGTVTFINGGQFFIQDASGALQVYVSDHGLAVDDYVVLKDGKKITKNEIPQLEGASVESEEAGTPITPTVVSLATVVADPAKYLSQIVSTKGVTIVSTADSTFFKEGLTRVFVNKLTLDPATYNNALADVTYIVSTYNGAVSLKAWEDNITLLGGAGHDDYVYPARGARGEYKLTNKWLYSNVLDNFASNKPNKGGAQTIRGMVANNGKFYFMDGQGAPANDQYRGHQLVIVDANTGVMLDPVPLARNIWTKTVKAADGVTDSIAQAATLLAGNDIKCDDAGNLLIGSCSANTGDFQVWKVNPETGEGELVIHETLYDDIDGGKYDPTAADGKGEGIAWRIDAFDVYGDVNTSAIIMAANASAMNVFKWTIEDGKQVGPSEIIDLYVDPSENSYLIQQGAMITNPGTAPQIYIVGEEYFYIDGFSTYPTLFDMSGTLADDFKNCAAGLKVGNVDGDTTTVQTQQNGLVEFQVGNEYFLLITAAGTTGGNNFALYKYADEARSWADMTPMWYFPAAGMGSASNGGRTAVPSVEVDQQTGLAKLYIYACENGYGMYEFQGVGENGPYDGLESTTLDAAKVQKVLRDGQIIIRRNGVEYNVLGAQVK